MSCSFILCCVLLFCMYFASIKFTNLLTEHLYNEKSYVLTKNTRFLASILSKIIYF